MNNIAFVENKGQWNNNVVYKAKLPAGNLYLEQNELTYQFYDEQDITRLHDLHHHLIKNPTSQDLLLHLHAFKIKFLGAATEKITASDPAKDFINYFIGNDKSKWATKVKKYKNVQYTNLYNGIDFKFYLKEGYLKYDFIVAPGVNPHQIQYNYEGINELYLEKGALKIKTSVNEMIEQKPYAYQLINGKEKEVKCNFKLNGNKLSYEFPKGYNKNYELIIDPTLVFASYSGSTADNWGYTSTFDAAGNLYGGGVAFGVGYPTTIGASQMNFNGGNGNYAGGCDISITKFSPNGTSLIYSTYLGGIGNESPHSLIVNSNDELLVLGTTSSNNFPVTSNALDTSFNGGTLYAGSIPNYIAGSDIIISKLSTNGSTLMASTYVGGTGNDGLNTGAILKYNYADDYRGEIIIDANDNVYVASSTNSTDFPVVAGAFQPASGGAQDGCVFKLSSNLSTLLASSYIGGIGDDAAYSLQFNTLGDILIAGGTVSPNFPVTAGTIQPVFQGIADGFVSRINNATTTLIASTYLGTTDYDQTYFVQTDTANNVYVVGQTEGTYTITPAAVYNVPNSGQFLHKLSSNLTSTIFSTTFGTGSGEVDISLSAFLVNECNYIFISGWGGSVNVSFGGAPFSTTNGLPITSNAIQSTTDGSDYYLIMLNQNAASLMFGTYFGGSSSNDHVDGGTSRFDKKGIVYQAVCSSCGIATSDFPTTPGVWSNTNNSGNCNLGVFKIDLTTLTAGASVYASPYHCIGDTVHFQNLSNGGINYYWDFGDGDTSSLFEPYHPYDSVGVYTVMLVSVDSATCLKRDTDYVDLYINLPPVASTTPASLCKGDSIQLGVTGGLVFNWQPNYNIINNNTATPTVFPDTTTLYTIIISDSCGVDTAQVLVTVFQKNISVSPDTMICLGQSVPISAGGGISYSWSPSASLDNANIANPIASPLSNTIYTVAITDANSCVWDTIITVNVDSVMPVALGSVSNPICAGDTVEIYASGGTQFSWSPTGTLMNPTDSSTLAFPIQTTNYVIEVANGCGVDYDTVLVEVRVVQASVSPDTIVCVGDIANLFVYGGVSYLWSPTGDTTNQIHPIINTPTTFTVEVTDITGCSITLPIFVDTLIKPTINLGVDIETAWGTKVQLNAVSNGISFTWSPVDGLSCIDCPNPEVKAKETTTYIVMVEGANGCFNYDTITIVYDGAIYLPNSFTPGSSTGVNDMFYAYGVDIVKFEMYIFDRWGEQLFFTDDLTKGWDGTYEGKIVPNDAYVVKVWYEDVLENRGTIYSTVTLIK